MYRLGGYRFVDDDPLRSWLGEDEIRSFAPWLSWIEYEPDQFLFKQGSPILGGYLLQHGAVQLIKYTVQGPRLLIRCLKDKDWVCTGFLGGERWHPFSARAMVSSHVRFIVREALMDMLDRFPKLVTGIQKRAETDLRALEEKLALYSRGSAPSKVAALLLEFAQAYGIAHPKGLRITVPVRGAAMSELIAVNPATFSKCLMDFERRGWVMHSGSQVWVCQESELRRVVEG